MIAGLALLALLLLAASLNNLQMAEGQAIPFDWRMPNLSDSGASSEMGRILLAVFRGLIIMGWVLLPFYIIYLIISKEARKRFVRDMLMLLPILILLYLLSNNNMGRRLAEEINPFFSGEQFQEMEGGEEFLPLPEFTEPPAWITTVTSLILAVALTVIVLGIAFVIWRRTRRRDLEPLLIVEQEAQAAVDAIEAGGDLREVVMRCYFQMIDALRRYRNINRDRDMTPHEFEEALTRRGLPGEPVHQLTVLFEQVRYGGHKPGRQEERQAINSLSAIVSACKRWQERQS